MIILKVVRSSVLGAICTYTKEPNFIMIIMLHCSLLHAICKIIILFFYFEKLFVIYDHIYL